LYSTVSQKYLPKAISLNIINLIITDTFKTPVEYCGVQTIQCKL